MRRQEFTSRTGLKTVILNEVKDLAWRNRRFLASLRVTFSSSLGFETTSSLLTLLVLLGLQQYADHCPAQGPGRQITKSFTEPFETSQVAAAEQGIVRKIHVKEGQSVREGELLAELDDDVLRESRRFAEAKVRSKARVNAATALMNLSKLQKENFDQLQKEGHANASEVSKVNAEYEAALAELQLAQDEAIQNQIELDRINAQVRQRKIVSPMNAVVVEIHRHKGEYISANEPKFATVVKLDRLRVRFYLHVDDLDQLSSGQKVEVRIGKNQENCPATVEFVSPVIDPNSGTGRVDLVIDNPDLKIRSGVVCYWKDRKSGSTAFQNSLREHK